MNNHRLPIDSSGLDLSAYSSGAGYYGQSMTNMHASLSEPKTEAFAYKTEDNNPYGNAYNRMNSEYNSVLPGSTSTSPLDSIHNMYAKSVSSHEPGEVRDFNSRPASATLRAYSQSLPHGHMQDVPVKNEYSDTKNDHIISRHPQDNISSGYSGNSLGSGEYNRSLAACASAVGGSQEDNAFGSHYQNIPRAHSQSATTSYDAIQKEGLFSNSPGLQHTVPNNEEESKFRVPNWSNEQGLSSVPFDTPLPKATSEQFSQVKKESVHDDIVSTLSRQDIPYTNTADMSSAYAQNLQWMMSRSPSQTQQYQNALQYYNMYQQAANSGLNFGQQFFGENKPQIDNYSRVCNLNSGPYNNRLQSPYGQAGYFPSPRVGYGMGLYAANTGYRPDFYGQQEQFPMDPYAQQAAKRGIYSVQDRASEKKGKKWGKRMKVEDEDEDDDYDYSLCNQWHVLSKEHADENVPTIFDFPLIEESLPISERYMLVERRLCEQLKQIQFQRPVSHIYNPLVHAFETHSNFVRKYCTAEKPVLFLGMNPGPFGMVQNGVPFGEVSVVRDWFCIRGRVVKPSREHPNRPVVGLEFRRAEVSGSRFWGFFKKHCGSPENFFRKCFVHNLCPLAFMSRSGRNLTPPDLSLMDRNLLNQTCSIALLELIEILGVQDIIAVGRYVEARALQAVKEGNVTNVRIHCLQHPSPLNPQANKGWDDIAFRTLRDKDLLQYFDIADSEG